MAGFLDSPDPRAALLELKERIAERIYDMSIRCGVNPDELDVANPQVTPVGLNGTPAVQALALLNLCETYVAIEKKLGLRQ